jgi:hypothetical protein
MSELSTLPSPAEQPVYYLPTVNSPTRIVKTLTMMGIIANSINALFSFILLVSAMAQSPAGQSSSTVGVYLFFLLWSGACLWLCIAAYNSILALRRECLAAKLTSQS